MADTGQSGHPDPGDGARGPFAPLVHEFLSEEYQAAPVMASGLGLTEFDARLDDLSQAAFEQRLRRAAGWRARFRAMSDAELNPEERIDRELAVSVLAGRLIMGDWEAWRRQPEIYVGPGLYGVFGLFLHRLRPEPELVRDAALRLRALPEALGHGRRNLVPELVPPVFVDRAIGQARAGARYVRELLPTEVRDPALRPVLAGAGAAAGAALDEFAGFLEELRGRATGGFAIGETRYGRLLREKEHVALDAGELHTRGRAEYERLAAELGELAGQVAGHADWAAVVRDLNRDHPRSPEAMRLAYADWTEQARAFLRARQLVTLPEGEACLVVPSPPFQRPVLAVASYSSPPPFSPSRLGHFFVPFPPEDASPEDVRQRLENNSYAGIPTTAVHEAYPGHHWHLVTAKAHPSALRRTFRTPYFSEGWALYAEHMMREQGFFVDPRHELFQVEALLFRAARIVVDTSLHAGEMTLDDARRFMEERANLTLPTARAEVARYAAWPTQASAYLVGCLEILAIRDRHLARTRLTGVAALRDFHDRLAGSGGLPPALAERSLSTGA
jgi:uncharacterized protein (DUF885 family)